MVKKFGSLFYPNCRHDVNEKKKRKRPYSEEFRPECWRRLKSRVSNMRSPTKDIRTETMKRKHIKKRRMQLQSKGLDAGREIGYIRLRALLDEKIKAGRKTKKPHMEKTETKSVGRDNP